MAFSYDFLPPIVPDILPTFVGNKIKLYFSVKDGYKKDLSSIGINTIQCSIVNQETGEPYYCNDDNLFEGSDGKSCEEEEYFLGDHYL